MTEDIRQLLVRELQAFVREVELFPEAEFTTRHGRREDVARELHETAAVVSEALARLPQDALEKPYPQPVANLQLPCRLFLMHLAVHLGFHLGQAGYLRRIVTGDGRSTGPVSLQALAER